MCGIVYLKDFRGRDVVPKVKSRYKAQRSRGTQGFGYYIPQTNRLTHNPDEMRLLNNMMGQTASEVLFHHRFPTSTANVQNACHPFSTKWDGFKHNYVMVHNGWLTNDYELEQDHDLLGIRYVSQQPDYRFNDSEALVYDLALYLEGYQDKLNAKGAIAFVMIERDEDGKAVKLHYGRNTGSPLKFKLKRGKFMSLTSEGDGVDVEPNKLHTYDYTTGEFTSKDLTIPGYEAPIWTEPAWKATPGSRSLTYLATKDYYGDDYSQYSGHADRTWDLTSKEWDDYYAGVSYDTIMARRPQTQIVETTFTASPKKRGSIVTRGPEMAEDYITKAGDDTDQALGDLELDLIGRTNELTAKEHQATLLIDADDASLSNEFLAVEKDIERLKHEIDVMEQAMYVLMLAAEETRNEPIEATEARILQLSSGDRE